MVRHLRHLFERRQQAWDRVIELENRAAPDFERTAKLLRQSLELLAANDAAGARRHREEVEQSNSQQEEAEPGAALPAANGRFRNPRRGNPSQ